MGSIIILASEVIVGMFRALLLDHQGVKSGEWVCKLVIRLESNALIKINAKSDSSLSISFGGLLMTKGRRR